MAAASPPHPPRHVMKYLAAIVLSTAGAVACAQGLPDRLKALSAAVDQLLDQSPGEGAKAYPAEWRKVAWLMLDGDQHPDALVVLRRSRDDCAAASRGSRPCRALLMRSTAPAEFTLANEFAPGEHPVVLRKSARGMVDAMYHTRDSSAQPVYRRFLLRGGRFEPDGSVLPASELMATVKGFVVDDRSLPLLADQVYAAAQFDNQRARLAPFRLHVDGINHRPRRASVADGQFSERAAFLATQLANDAARLVEAIRWHQTLDLRIWACDDWMVPRRFWEVEDFRLGRIGVCADPAVFALRRGLVDSATELVAMTRFRLLQEVGLAFMLRVVPMTGELRDSLKAPTQRETLVFHGAVAGLMLGSSLKLQTPEAAWQMLGLWKRVSDQWFVAHEREHSGYAIKSPELRAFDHDLAEAEKALLCTLRALGSALPVVRGAPCSPQAMDSIQYIRAVVREALTP